MAVNPEDFGRSPSTDDQSRPIKRVRASKPKVKSGCITCKARRVKCDETKPQCIRCQKFGRICDGYTLETPSRGSVMLIQPRIPAADFYTPSVSLQATEEEGRYFRYFCEHTAHQLPGYFDPTFWNYIILQESHGIAPIRHAIIAIGALNKSLESAPRPHLKVNVIQEIDRKHHEFAVLQHLKAIQALKQYISNSTGPQLRTALITCLLFVCFETFQGSYATSVQQTYGGLKLLRSYYACKPGSKPWVPRRISADANTKPQTDKVIAKVQNRPGMDNASKSAIISMHIEEYLETEKPTQPSPEDQSSIIPAPMHRDLSPRMDEVTIPLHYKSSLTIEQQRSLSNTPVQEYPSAYHTPSQYLVPDDNHPTYSAPVAQEAANSPPSQTNSAYGTPDSVHTPPSMGNTPPPMQYRSSQSPPIAMNPRKRPHESRSPTPPLLQNDYTLEENIIQAFVRLDGQGLFFGMTPGIPPLLWDIHSTHHLPVPQYFNNFAEAQHCWDFLMDRTLQYYRRTLFDRKYAGAKSDSPEEIATQYAHYVKLLGDFERAYQPILEEAIASDGTVLNPAAIVLATHLKATAITLSAVTTTSEMVYDQFMSSFRYIVRAGERLITSYESTHFPQNSRFSLDIGVVPPLHVVATKCREPNIRRKAVDLLFRIPRQEGMWDGVLSARIGRWIVGCEEDGLDIPTPIEPIASPTVPRIQGYNYANSSSADGFVVQNVQNDDELYQGSGVPRQHSAAYWAQSSNTLFRTPSPDQSQINSTNINGGAVDPNTQLWTIPEDRRFKLVIVDFHMQERYIMVKCHKAIPRRDGTREERESIIAW
ncbi:putative UPC2 Regulatory involved in control of sterol uptake protein [Rutstroemia sp. NJR-2017a BBW]|nr:putative UPC2 Regulatory involved in control of sterol uptake protein [Rutstroemia sp. NJR-2017a BBW]